MTTEAEQKAELNRAKDKQLQVLKEIRTCSVGLRYALSLAEDIEYVETQTRVLEEALRMMKADPGADGVIEDQGW